MKKGRRERKRKGRMKDEGKKEMWEGRCDIKEEARKKRTG